LLFTPRMCIAIYDYNFTPFFLYSYGAPRDLHSFPTRRSSDLGLPRGADGAHPALRRGGVHGVHPFAVGDGSAVAAPPNRRMAARSEEHTSELQSLAYLVCRLLLEKKNAAIAHSTSQLDTSHV